VAGQEYRCDGLATGWPGAICAFRVGDVEGAVDKQPLNDYERSRGDEYVPNEHQSILETHKIVVWEKA